MNILVINGSPKANRSNSYRLTRAFLEGMATVEAMEIRAHTVANMNIHPCIGCYTCWKSTSGKCCFDDDMTQVISDLLWADKIIWSFPLYYFSLPGALKNLMDRQLPTMLPFHAMGAVSGAKLRRFDMSGKHHVLISTCGFFTADGNYSAVTGIFDRYCGPQNYTTIFCGQGELFGRDDFNDYTDRYLSYVKQAGVEFLQGGITEQTRIAINSLILPRLVFEKIADDYWCVEKSVEDKKKEALLFTRQVTFAYKCDSWQGDDQYLDVYFTDLNLHYQLLLKEKGAWIRTMNFNDSTTRLEIPYDLWKTIGIGMSNAALCVENGECTVTGNQEIILNWNKYFDTLM